VVDYRVRLNMAEQWFADEPSKRERVERAVLMEEIERLQAQVAELTARYEGTK